jgi:hypothetical protein
MLACGIAAIWDIWKSRNKVVFDKVLLRDPGSVVGLMTYWMTNWACLQKTSVRDAQVAAASLLTKMSLEAFSVKQGWAPVRKRIC